jgi:hypothetical protein
MGTFIELSLNVVGVVQHCGKYIRGTKRFLLSNAMIDWKRTAGSGSRLEFAVGASWEEVKPANERMNT